MEYKELMQGLAKKFAIENMVIFDDATALEIDDMPVGFIKDTPRDDEPGDAVIVVVELGFQPPDANGPCGDMLLKANYLFDGTGGAVLCKSPNAGAYTLMHRYPLVAHNVDTFAKALERLLDLAEDWKRAISGIRKAEDVKNEMDREAGSLHTSPSFGNFVRV